VLLAACVSLGKNGIWCNPSMGVWARTGRVVPVFGAWSGAARSHSVVLLAPVCVCLSPVRGLTPLCVTGSCILCRQTETGPAWAQLGDVGRALERVHLAPRCELAYGVWTCSPCLCVCVCVCVRDVAVLGVCKWHKCKMLTRHEV
jgi:hypothetical protein